MRTLLRNLQNKVINFQMYCLLILANNAEKIVNSKKDTKEEMIAVVCVACVAVLVSGVSTQGPSGGPPSMQLIRPPHST